MLSGAMTGAAVIVRPNLVPLAGIIALWIASSRTDTLRERAHSVAVFGMAALPFALAVMALQNAMYGGPLKSGYGELGALFTLDHVWPNALRYPRWLLETQTPFVALALAAPWVRELGTRRSETWWLLAFAAATLVSYLPYVVFDAWWYLRFVLPAIAVLLSLSAAVANHIVSRLPREWRTPALGLGCGMLVVFHITTAAHRQVFELRDLERRYRIGGEYVAAHLPLDAAVLTVHQSGSVRFYSGRPTLVWADLDSSSLERALEYLRSRDLRPFLLFESWEEQDFRRRFGAKSATGRLEWPPMADIDRQIRIYDPAQYAPFIRGESVRTDQVWTRRK
jgi:hypothetical protein